MNLWPARPRISRGRTSGPARPSSQMTRCSLWPSRQNFWGETWTGARATRPVVSIRRLPRAQISGNRAADDPGLVSRSTLSAAAGLGEAQPGQPEKIFPKFLPLNGDGRRYFTCIRYDCCLPKIPAKSGRGLPSSRLFPKTPLATLPPRTSRFFGRRGEGREQVCSRMSWFPSWAWRPQAAAPDLSIDTRSFKILSGAFSGSRTKPNANRNRPIA